MRIKQIIFTSCLLFAAVAAVADDYVRVKGKDGQTLAIEDIRNLDSISLTQTTEFYGNYLADFNNRHYYGNVVTGKGTFESGLYLKSDMPQVCIENADPYFYYFGYTSMDNYNIIPCFDTRVVGDTIFMYAENGCPMNYSNVAFYSPDYCDTGDENDIMVFAITDGGETFIYVSGLVVCSSSFYDWYDIIDPYTAISTTPGDSLTTYAPMRQSAFPSGRQGKSLERRQTGSQAGQIAAPQLKTVGAYAPKPAAKPVNSGGSSVSKSKYNTGVRPVDNGLPKLKMKEDDAVE